MNKILLLIVFIFSFLNIGKSQTDSLDIIIEKFIESYLEDNDLESFDYIAQIEYLEELSKNPFDLNNLSLADLDNIFFLNPLQKQSIVEHRNLYGNFLGLEELQTVNAIDFETAKVLRRLLKVGSGIGNNTNLFQSLKNANHSVFLKYKNVLQQRKGYIKDENGNSNYIGNANHYLLRYRIDGGSKLKAGFIAEKDPGEEFFTGSNKKGFDYYSAHLYIQNPFKNVKALSLGDYSISMGQGLILHNDFGNGKSAYVMNIKRDGKAIRPYNSVNESNFFRGLATTFNVYKNVDLTGFYSFKKIDGTVSSDTIENEDFDAFSAIIRDGFHRTQSEIAKRGSTNQTNYGGSLIYSKKRLRIGINHLQYHFSRPLIRDIELYNLYSFRGKSLSNTSIDYSYIKRNINLFGEVARCNNGGMAQIHTALISLDRKVDAAISYRKYDKDYQVLEANAFSEASMPINEEAFYLAVDAKLNNNWKISSYADVWKNEWAKFNVDAPSTGKEALVRLEYNQRRLINLYVQYRYEHKFINNNDITKKIDYIIPITQHRFRFHVANKINKDLELRNRVEWVFYEKNNTRTKGYLIFQDLIYKPIGKRYSFTSRYALFDTDDFNSRIYSYENDIQYEFAVPFFYEKGKRFYFLAKYKLNRSLALEARYSLTSYSNLDIISQGGNDEIRGNNRSEIKVQMRWSL